MADWFQYFGNLHNVLPEHWAGIILVAVSVLCGVLVGAEREAKQKAAGIRTVTLICIGSTIFTLASVLLAEGNDDHTRIAAQVVTGVGFLGAGAIIRNRGNIIGLTTGATIWTVAAIGVLVGGGYAAAGIVLTVVVVFTLAVVGRVETGVLEPCRFTELELVYNVDSGKTRVRLLRILDDYRVPDKDWSVAPVDGSAEPVSPAASASPPAGKLGAGQAPARRVERETMKLRYCHFHRSHRALLFDLAEVPGILEVRRERTPREHRT